MPQRRRLVGSKKDRGREVWLRRRGAGEWNEKIEGWWMGKERSKNSCKLRSSAASINPFNKRLKTRQNSKMTLTSEPLVGVTANVLCKAGFLSVKWGGRAYVHLHGNIQRIKNGKCLLHTGMAPRAASWVLYMQNLRSWMSFSYPPWLPAWQRLDVCLRLFSLCFFSSCVLSKLKSKWRPMSKAHISGEAFPDCINLCCPVRPLRWVPPVAFKVKKQRELYEHPINTWVR